MKKETKNERSMFKMSVIIKRAIIALILVLVGCFALSFVSSNNVFASANLNYTNFYFDLYQIEDSIQTDSSSIIDDNFILPHDSLRNQMINEVEIYINRVTRGKYDKMLPQYLVDNALEHNIDLCFMMSQTEIETAFGTTGAGRSSSRRSLFGIIKRKWSNYNDAINDYCLLLKKSYLVRGRTEQDLLKRYVTGSGARYAVAKNYEYNLRKTYNEIRKKTNLINLQNSYNNEYQIYIASLSDSLTIDSISS